MEQEVTFKSSTGHKVAGLLANPSGDTSKPIIIICHGFRAHKKTRTSIGLFQRFNKMGFSTLRFDFFGHGESEGNYENITLTEAVDDVMQAIAFVKKQGFTKIGLTGNSFGGQCSLLAAAKSKDLTVLGLICPVIHYQEKEHIRRGEKGIKEWKEKGFVTFPQRDGNILRLKHAFYEDISTYNGYEEAKKINTPTIIIHGDEDLVVPIEQSQKAATVLQNGILNILEGADHYFSKEKDFVKMLDLVTKFFSEQLS